MSNPKEYGLFLQEEREKQKLTFEQVAKDTKITIKVLQGLESMEKGLLPSETYRVGMLKLYAKYLKIDQAKIIEMVKVNEIQEKPVEFDLINLQEKKEEQIKKHIHLGIIALILVFIVLFFVFGINKKIANAIATSTERRIERKNSAIETIETINGFYESNFTLDEKLRLTSGNKEAILKIVSINPPSIMIEDKTYDLEINQPSFADLDNDGTPEYIIFMRSLNSARKQVLLRFDPKITKDNLAELDYSSYDKDEITADGNKIEILQSASVESIQISLSFNQLSYYKIKSNEEILAEENVRRGAEKNLISQDPVRIYLSNSNFADLKVNNQDVNFIKDGLPIVLYIAWDRKDNGFVLTATPLP